MSGLIMSCCVYEKEHCSPSFHTVWNLTKSNNKSWKRELNLNGLLFTRKHNYRPAFEEFHIVANSYRYAYPELKALYFAVVDYEDAPQIFSQLKLMTVPAILHFPAKGAKKKIDEMDFQRQGLGADSMARFIKDRTDIQVVLFLYIVFIVSFISYKILKFRWNLPRYLCNSPSQRY